MCVCWVGVGGSLNHTMINREKNYVAELGLELATSSHTRNRMEPGSLHLLWLVISD